jgi:hypothetical protein
MLDLTFEFAARRAPFFFGTLAEFCMRSSWWFVFFFFFSFVLFVSHLDTMTATASLL